MRRSLLSLSLMFAVAALAACDAPSQTLLQPEAPIGEKGIGNGSVVASASGSGIRTGSTRHFQFSAMEKADGTVNGRFNLTNAGPDNFYGRGDVICMQVDGNRAWIGTRITNSSVPGYVGLEGGFYVEDNGEGKDSDDQLSLAFVNGGPGFAQRVCDGLTGIEFTATTIDGGNVQVR